MVIKIPMVLLMGVTTLDAPRNSLPSHVMQQLCPSKFILRSPAERMDAIVEAALVKQCSGFCIGHKVAVFLRNYFLNQDGTLTSFIRALKIACSQNFSMEPLGFILGVLVEEDGDITSQNYLFLASLLVPRMMRITLSSEVMLKYASEHLSYQRNEMAEQIDSKLACGLAELKHIQKSWSAVVMLYFNASDPLSELWRIAWIISAFWTLLAFVVLAVICTLWASSRNPTGGDKR